MIIICQRCGHKWNYKGAASFYASCPNCMVRVNIKKHAITLDQTEEANVKLKELDNKEKFVQC